MKKTFIITIIILCVISAFYFTYQFNYNEDAKENNYLPNIKDNNNNKNKDKEYLNKITVNDNYIDLTLNEYGLELPINGATGYTLVDMDLMADNKTDVITTLNAGTPFQIIKEEAEYWYVLVNNTYGYLNHTYCMINLPDVIPSIIYNNTNSYSSILSSSGFPLDNITGKALYDAKEYNERLQKEEFLMPVLYSMAKKIAKVQNDALKNGDSLEIYEAYRPFDVQMQISAALSNLMDTNDIVKSSIEDGIWGKGWFVATKLSNHQKGFAIDTHLVKIKNINLNNVGNYQIVDITNYEEYTMPSQIQELSNKAVVFVKPVNSMSKTAWQNVSLSESMTEGSIKLQNYCTSNNLYPLASEWWHFNDLDSYEETKDNSGKGKFYITKNLSIIPN